MQSVWSQVANEQFPLSLSFVSVLLEAAQGENAQRTWDPLNLKVLAKMSKLWVGAVPSSMTITDASDTDEERLQNSVRFSVPSSGLTVLQKILDTAAEQSWQVTSVNLDALTEAAFIKLLADLDYKKDFQIIINCELERLNYILNLVKSSVTLTPRS